jgi:hypothetical protein
MEPTLVTWVLVVFGAIALSPLTVAYLAFLRSPYSPKSKELMISKGEDWRDKTHFRFALGGAWADVLFLAPLFVSGSVGALVGQTWGYVLFGAAGAISLYINIILWFTEKEYVYPSRGPLRYFTYYWGFFVYWGALALAYSALRVGGIEF